MDSTDQTVTARIYHNSVWDRGRAPLYGFEDGNPVTLVAQLEIGLDDGPSADLACHCVFGLLNIGNDPAFGPPHPAAVAYFERGNRALSVGDVVEFPAGPFPGFYAVAPSGFTRIAPPAIAAEPRPGTVPLCPEPPER
jgi:hypothetical protein